MNKKCNKTKAVAKSAFCGFKGFFTFNLSLVLFGNYYFYILLLNKERGAKSFDEKYERVLQGKEAAFNQLKKNIIPFFEVSLMIPVFYLCISKLPLPLCIVCASICMMFMMLLCFTIRVAGLREDCCLEKVVDEIPYTENGLLRLFYSKKDKVKSIISQLKKRTTFSDKEFKKLEKLLTENAEIAELLSNFSLQSITSEILITNTVDLEAAISSALSNETLLINKLKTLYQYSKSNIQDTKNVKFFILNNLVRIPLFHSIQVLFSLPLCLVYLAELPVMFIYDKYKNQVSHKETKSSKKNIADLLKDSVNTCITAISFGVVSPKGISGVNVSKSL